MSLTCTVRLRGLIGIGNLAAVEHAQLGLLLGIGLQSLSWLVQPSSPSVL
jgi:hypothetical protein